MSSNLSGCCTCTKYTFIFFNFIFFLVGAAALGVGIWAQVSEEFTQQVHTILSVTFKISQEDVEKVVDAETIDSAAILIIVGGAVVMVLGFIGCFGAMKENQCLLGTFFVLMFLILGVLVAGVVLVMFFPETVSNNFKPVLKKVVDEWRSSGSTNQTIDLIQHELKCCGVDGKQDYNSTVPESCKDPSDNTIYDRGCLAAFKEKINELLSSQPWIVGGVGIGVLAIIVIGMILSCCLCTAVRKSKGDVF